MPPEATDEELGLDPQEMEALDPNIRAELRESRKAKRERDQAQADLAQARKEAAFARAGIPDTALGQMFTKAFDGPIDDPAAIKAQFEALNPAPPASETTPATEGATDQELQALGQVAQLGTPGASDGSVPFEQAIGSAKNPDEVMALLAAAPETALDAQGRRVVPPQVN